ncbi:MAG TPA: sigma-54 dependent transcriptional regulator [Pyrinomonadaceae bacterium]|nr:sigma-54 dependent transcriptional regulator [Pyrinomonadaceae bacterium]
MPHDRILVVDDEASVTDALKLILAERGHAVQTAGSVAEATARFADGSFDLVLTDLLLPDGTGLDLLTRIKSEAADVEVILMTAHGSLDVVIEAIKRGAFYYLEKPFSPAQVQMLVGRALQCLAIRRENRALKGELPGAADFGLVGHHPTIQQIHQLIRTAAPSDASVLIEGESGTGKELIATALHLQSARARHPFIEINCAAIPQELIESELFGYRKGAFTGATRDKRGLIEAASGGTLFLDEIAEMPARLQPKLLRVLQERKVRRLGDEQEVEVDFRLVSSTNRDTARMIEAGALRKDLYFRISTIKVRVSPLRERLDDVVLLAERFLARYSEKYHKRIHGISPAALTLLTRYDWPGNVRELEGIVERAVLFAQAERLTPADMPEHIRATQPNRRPCAIPPYLTLEEIEREALVQTLERTDGNVSKAAQLLDLHRPRFYRMLKKFGLADKRKVHVAADGARPFREADTALVPCAFD